MAEREVKERKVKERNVKERKVKERKPKLSAAQLKNVSDALIAAATAQTAFWDALSELESAVGFQFCIDNEDLELYAGDAREFLGAAWDAREGQVTA